MKRPLIITVGVVIILLVLGIWVYLLLFGAPNESDDVFTNLGFDFTPRETAVVTPPAEEGYSVDVSSGLQQLTTRPVAGFIATETASSSFVRYVEQGTGHIYQIDLITGSESLISRTTIPRVRSAVFSPDAANVAVNSSDAGGQVLYVGSIDPDTQSLIGDSWQNLVPNARNVAFLDNTTLAYTISTAESQIGNAYDVTSDENIRELFRLPFKDVRIIWGEGEIYAYNRAADTLQGYLYEVRNGTFYPTTFNGYGFVAEMNDAYLAQAKLIDGVYISTIVDRITNEVYRSPSQIIPEKCVLSDIVPERLWCAEGFSTAPLSLTDWYKGLVTPSDSLWEVNLGTESATLRQNLESTSGRPIDVNDLTLVNNDSLLLFTNKIDNTLWKFDIQTTVTQTNSSSNNASDTATQ